jgi:hypothetical protein
VIPRTKWKSQEASKNGCREISAEKLENSGDIKKSRAMGKV